MNPNIHQLYQIAAQPQRLIIGLMSGTSLDGLDVALCRFIGSGLSTELELLAFETVPYTEEIKNEIPIKSIAACLLFLIIGMEKSFIRYS